MRGPRGSVEGRVFARSNDGVLVGDALARHAVTVRDPAIVASIEVGDLVRILCETCDDGSLVGREIERVFDGSRRAFDARSEARRFATQGHASRLVARAAIVERVRAFFRAQGFVEVDTPSIAPCPGLDLHLTAFAAIDTASDAALGYLVTSPEYHMKRLLVGGVSRCFQLARCFRTGESGTRHEPEFTMLEWYRAWATLDDLVRDTEALVRAACASYDVARHDGGTVSLEPPFERFTVREAFARWAPEVTDPIALAERDEHEYFRLLGERIEPQLGRERPAFLTHFAARHASLARLDPEDPSVCLRAELYIDGLELSNGFVELTDPREQRQRFERDVRDRAARGLPAYPIDEDFLSALEEGLPPAVGNAMGLDRLVAIALATRDLREVIAFSHRRSNS